MRPRGSWATAIVVLETSTANRFARRTVQTMAAGLESEYHVKKRIDANPLSASTRPSGLVCSRVLEIPSLIAFPPNP
jgi:hypothetical protein